MSPGPGVALRVAAAQTLDAVVHRGHSLKVELAQRLPAIADPRDAVTLRLSPRFAPVYALAGPLLALRRFMKRGKAAGQGAG